MRYPNQYSLMIIRFNFTFYILLFQVMIWLFPARCWAGWFSNQNEQRSLVLHLLIKSILGNSFGSLSVRYQANTDLKTIQIKSIPKEKWKLLNKVWTNCVLSLVSISCHLRPPAAPCTKALSWSTLPWTLHYLALLCTKALTLTLHYLAIPTLH